MLSAEALLHQQVCDYLRFQYPDVIFHSDFAAGTKMTMGQAIRNKRLQSSRAWPDLFIAEPHWDNVYPYLDINAHGLFIELKAAGTRLKSGNMPNTDHIKEQQDMLDRLSSKGYKAVFACGFDEAKKIIDEYLK